MLQKLYKLEHQNARFAEFLNKDFSEPKTRKVAQKNAMALVPKLKYHLSMAFFLLGDDLHGAIQVALERCKDPMLAALTCRLYDPDNKTTEIKELMQQEFIDRGEKFNDQYLQNIGFWHKREFLNAVNKLAPMKQDSLAHLFNHKTVEFHLHDK